MIGTKLATALVSFGVTMGIGMIGQAAAEPTTITEDSPGWDCRTMGNQICGPVDSDDCRITGNLICPPGPGRDNPEGFPAGRYDHGVIVETWPQMLARCGHSDICLGA